VNGEYGNYNAVKVSGAVNLPIGDRWALRVSGQHASHDGYYSDGYDDENTQAARAQLKFDSRTGFDATLMLDYGHVGGKGSGGTIMPLIGNGRLGPSDPAVVAAYLAASPTAPVPQVVAQPNGFQSNNFYGAALTVNQELGFAKLTVIPPSARPISTFCPMPRAFTSAIRNTPIRVRWRRGWPTARACSTGLWVATSLTSVFTPARTTIRDRTSCW
jgi:hypothetical protein